MFIILLSVCETGTFGESLLASNSERRINCVFLNNQQCKARPTFADINFKET